MKTNKISTGLAALAFCFALTTAQAQALRPAPETDRPTTWQNNLGEQLARSLQSPSQEIRSNALHQVTYFARFHGDQIDLKMTIPALLAIYKADPNEQCRLAAVAGLHAIGDEEAMQKVRRAVSRQKSPRVQLVSLAALTDYYGPETFTGSEDSAAMAEALIARYDEADEEERPLAAANR